MSPLSITLGIYDPLKLKILETCLRCLYIHARDLWGIQDRGPRGIRDKGTYRNQGQGDLGESGTGGLEFIRYTGLEGIPISCSLFFLVIVDMGNSSRIAFLVSTGPIMMFGRVSANVTTQHNTWEL